MRSALVVTVKPCLPLPYSAIPSYCHSLILPFPHTAIPSYCHSLILPFPHTAIPSYCHSLILPFPHTAIPSYCHSLILPFPHTAIPSYCHSLIPCSSFVVRPPLISDLSGVEHLLGGLEGSECVMADVVRSVEGGRDGVKEGATPLSAMVAECAGQVVGVAVVRREEVSQSHPSQSPPPSSSSHDVSYYRNCCSCALTTTLRTTCT